MSFAGRVRVAARGGAGGDGGRQQGGIGRSNSSCRGSFTRVSRGKNIAFNSLGRFGYRAGIAVASLISGAVALHLHLWKRNYLAQIAADAASGNFEILQCGVGGGCVLAQTSPWSWFLGVDVALIGTVGYATVLVVALMGLVPRWLDARWPTVALMALIYPAVLFTLRLKYGEFIVLRTFCSWCAISAIAITICAILVTLDHRRLKRSADASPSTNGALSTGRSARG